METIEAAVSAILIADSAGTFVTRRVPEVELEFGGIRGDRHFGLTSRADVRQPMYARGTEILNRRQITIVSEEDCAHIAAQLGIGQVLPEWLGANILLSGCTELATLTYGSRILIGNGVGLLCMGENLPCKLPGQVIQEHYVTHPNLAKHFVRAAYRRRGIVCAVERPGHIHQGDKVSILVNDFAKPLQ